MIFDILTDSIRYTFSKPKNILILGILNLFDIFIIPLIFAIGYYYEISKESTEGTINSDEKMPPITNFKQLFINGLKVFTAGMIYCIPGFILYIVALQLSELGYIPYTLTEPLSDCLFFICYCYFYIALPNMAHYDSFKKAFDFKQINEIIIKKIGVLPLIVVLLFINLVEYAFESISANIVNIINSLNFTAFSTQTLTFIFGTAIFTVIITPVIDIMLSRSTGLLYVSDD